MRRPLPELRVVGHGPQPRRRLAGQGPGLGVHQVGVGRLGRAPDAAADLVELGQPELVGALDHEGVGPGDVEARLDDAGRDQHVGLAPHEGQHRLLELALGHLPVGHQHPQLGHQRAHALAGLVDGLDAVVQVEALAAAGVLAAQRLGHQLLVVLAHVGGDRAAAGRRGLDDADVAQPREGHLQRARDGRRAHGQHVGPHPQLAQGLLLGHAEALLLVDDDQPEVLGLHVHAQQPVGADQHVELAVAEPAQDLAGLGRRAEAVDHVHAHREVLEALAEGPQVLLGEQGGGHEHQHLLARDRGPERRAQGDLGLAEAHVAAHQPVHGARALHVVGHGVDRALLVGGLPVGEAALEVARPLVLGREGVALGPRPRLVQRDELAGQLAHGGAGAGLEAIPGLAAQPGERGGRPVGADVPADLVELVARHPEPVRPREGQGQVVAGHPGDGAGLEAQQPADAVVLVHDVVARP